VYRACEAFNRFYFELKVLDVPEHRASRLALVSAADRVIVHALGLLGLRALDRL
jgi:arginyl-tRNA synthetase